MPKILIVDDDPAIRDVVRFALTKAGFETIEAARGNEALDLFAACAPDAIVLDILLPEMDGTDICRELRRRSSVPIIFLSSKDEEIDRIVGLEIGADDYLVKPFSPRELVARVKAIIRRSNSAVTAGEPKTHRSSLTHGKLALDRERVRATWEDHEISLTATEFAILVTLMQRPGVVLSRDRLMDGAYSVDKVVSDRTIDSHIRRLRSKFAALGAQPIETLHGFGYKLGPCD